MASFPSHCFRASNTIGCSIQNLLVGQNTSTQATVSTGYVRHVVILCDCCKLAVTIVTTAALHTQCRYLPIKWYKTNKKREDVCSETCYNIDAQTEILFKDCLTVSLTVVFPEPEGVWIQALTGGGDQVERTHPRTLAGASRRWWRLTELFALFRVTWEATNSVSAFFQENERLKSSLMQAHTDISVLQSDLDKLKNLYIDQKELHGRWAEIFFFVLRKGREERKENYSVCVFTTEKQKIWGRCLRSVSLIPVRFRFSSKFHTTPVFFFYFKLAKINLLFKFWTFFHNGAILLG